MDAIEAAALNKRFRRIHAVRDVTFQVPQGAVYALMGPNGAGKTTLIKLLMNLMEPSSGRATMLGGSSLRLRGALLERIGYVSENQKQPEWMTVDRFLRYWRGFYPTWDRGLEDDLVRRFELPRKQRLRHLSRGVRMKVVLASVLAYRPKLIIMDEPLSGLDPLVRDDLMRTLVELAAGTTVLISSHDLAEIDSFSTHVGYMDSGRMHISEPMGQLRERFRKVTVKSAVALTAPEIPPADWLNFQAEGQIARWTETDFAENSSHTRARQILGEVQIQAEPMSLREIFLVMARPPRTAVESEASR